MTVDIGITSTHEYIQSLYVCQRTELTEQTEQTEMTELTDRRTDAGSRALGVILSQFPRYDEAFILRELVALEQGPQELTIFSLRPCRDRIIHDEAKSLIANTVYAPFLWSIKVWASHAYFWHRAPRAYWSALTWIVSRHWRHPLVLLKTLVLFPKTVHFARVALERGMGHLHAFWATYPATSAVIIERLTGIPYSLSGHAHDIYTTNPALVEKLHGAQFVVTCTETNRQHLLKLTDGFGTGDRGQGTRPSSHVPCPKTPIFVNYHGVDLARFAPQPKQAHEACHILAVGSLLPCKGYDTLIDACKLLKERAVPFHCTLAGGGPLERSLRWQIARHGLQREIEITGYVSQSTVAKLYQDADLVVLPLVSKIHWGIPNVLIEALATRTPVICCHLPSLSELVQHAVSGWIIPEQDPAALAKAVVDLWADPALRAQLAAEGHRRVVERFSLEETGRTLRSLFFTEGRGAWGVGRGKTSLPSPPVSRPLPLGIQ